MASRANLSTRTLSSFLQKKGPKKATALKPKQSKVKKKLSRIEKLNPKQSKIGGKKAFDKAAAAKGAKSAALEGAASALSQGPDEAMQAQHDSEHQRAVASHKIRG